MAERKLVGANNHHTLYYRKDFLSRPDTRQWRNHPVMVVPLYYDDHAKLHRNVRPVPGGLPSRDLTQFALQRCAMIQWKNDLTDIEAFASVRDELDGYHRRNRVSEMGREALRYSQQFSHQLQFMKDVPLIGR